MKVIFIDSVHPILFERLEKAGFTCEWKNHLNRKEILAILPKYQGAVIRSKFKFDEEVFKRADQLHWIARSGAGMENIDQNIAKQKGIKCYNSPEGNRDAVAEHALGMLLSLFNQLKQSDIEVRNAEWNREKNRGLELKGKTVGILGYGFMGEAFAKRLKGFDLNVIAYDKYKSEFGNEYVEEVSLEDFYLRTEILSVHLPLTKETQNLIDNDYIHHFKQNLYIVNTARGKNIKTDDLVTALKSGKIKGACLDVLEYEKVSFEALKKEELPEAFQYLSRSNKVILTPHVAGWTVESYYKLSNVLADKIIADLSFN